MIVAKFGGTSVADVSQFIKIKELNESKTRDIICVSALGKTQQHRLKITDLLYKLYNTIDLEHPYWSELYLRHFDIMRALDIKFDLKTFISQLKSDKNEMSLDEFVSRGEYLCARLFAIYLSYEFVDAKDIILFKSNNIIDYSQTYRSIRKKLNGKSGVVVPGFYGSQQGLIKIFSRGGSDVTAALIAAALKADLYENFTDVAGLYTADPNLTFKAEFIDRISYKHLDFLAKSGTNLYHMDGIYPIAKANIPLEIKSLDNLESRTLVKQGNYTCVNTFRLFDFSYKKYQFSSKNTYQKVLRKLDRQKVFKFKYPYIIYTQKDPLDLKIEGICETSSGNYILLKEITFKKKPIQKNRIITQETYINHYQIKEINHGI